MRLDLGDEECALLEPLLPKPRKRAGQDAPDTISTFSRSHTSEQSSAFPGLTFRIRPKQQQQL